MASGWEKSSNTVEMLILTAAFHGVAPQKAKYNPADERGTKAF